MTTERWMNRHPRAALVGVALLGLVFGACKGGKTKDPAVCMNECEAECPYTPDAMGGNDEYMSCVNACQTKCAG